MTHHRSLLHFPFNSRLIWINGTGRVSNLNPLDFVTLDALSEDIHIDLNLWVTAYPTAKIELGLSRFSLPIHAMNHQTNDQRERGGYKFLELDLARHTWELNFDFLALHNWGRYKQMRERERERERVQINCTRRFVVCKVIWYYAFEILCAFVTNLWFLVSGFGRMHSSFPLRGVTVVFILSLPNGSIRMTRTYIEFTWTCAHIMINHMFFLPTLLST